MIALLRCSPLCTTFKNDSLASSKNNSREILKIRLIAAPPQLDLLIAKCFGDLQFLSDEFSKLEVMVTPSELSGGES